MGANWTGKEKRYVSRPNGFVYLIFQGVAGILTYGDSPNSSHLTYVNFPVGFKVGVVNFLSANGSGIGFIIRNYVTG